MVHLGNAAPGQFCWVDLAASDADAAKAFYGRLFGWTSGAQAANGGSFTRLRQSDQDVGSVYQLSARHLENGVPSHWTPYLRVDDVDAVVQRAVALGGEVIVHPFVVDGTARIALILDGVGAHVGLWEPIGSDGGEENAHD
jgi:predicted enzyme related to lactoylglutathione lyase